MLRSQGTGQQRRNDKVGREGQGWVWGGLGIIRQGGVQLVHCGQCPGFGSSDHCLILYCFLDTLFLLNYTPQGLSEFTFAVPLTTLSVQ